MKPMVEARRRRPWPATKNGSVGQLAPNEKRLPEGSRLRFVVPGAGFEPAHLSATVFETVVSAVPPPGPRRIYAV